MGLADRGGRVRRGLVALFIVVAACGDATTVNVEPPPTTTTNTVPATVTTTLPEVTAPAVDQLPGFTRGDIVVGDETWRVALALSIDQRQQGLMGVTDLGDAEGMLFVFPFDTDIGFWMKDTLIPLEIAFFDRAGNLVRVLSMEPCVEDPCQIYSPGAVYRYALEAVPGRLAGLREGTVLDVGDL